MSAIKRLIKELQEIANEDTSNIIQATPIQDDLFNWHFTLTGPEDSVYAGGRYHGRVQFPTDYPFAPPSIYFLTPSGRFEVERKICLSVTGFHPEAWQPAWTVRTILMALRDHFTVEDRASIGYLDYSAEDRRDLATRSVNWSCPDCDYNRKEANEDVQNLNESKRDSPPNLLATAFILLLLSILLSYLYLSK